MKESNDKKKLNEENQSKTKHEEIIKKVLIGCIAIGLIVIAVMLVGNNSRINNNCEVPIEDITPVNNQVNLDKIFEEVEKIQGMENQNESGDIPTNSEDNESDTSNKVKPEEEIDFGRYKGLEMKAIVNTTDTTINEVWMIKLGNINQQEDVCRILGRRIQKLKNAFREDEAQTRILNEAVIKQEDGIVIMVIAQNKNEIEKTIGNLMSEK